MVRTLCFHCTGYGFDSLVREIRSFVPHGLEKEYKKFKYLSSLSPLLKIWENVIPGTTATDMVSQKTQRKSTEIQNWDEKKQECGGTGFCHIFLEVPMIPCEKGKQSCKLSAPLLIMEPLKLLLAHMATQSENYILQGPLLPIVAIWLNSGQLKLLERVLKMQRHALMLPLSEVNL